MRRADGTSLEPRDGVSTSATTARRMGDGQKEAGSNISFKKNWYSVK